MANRDWDNTFRIVDQSDKADVWYTPISFPCTEGSVDDINDTKLRTYVYCSYSVASTAGRVYWYPNRTMMYFIIFN